MTLLNTKGDERVRGDKEVPSLTSGEEQSYHGQNHQVRKESPFSSLC